MTPLVKSLVSLTEEAAYYIWFDMGTLAVFPTPVGDFSNSSVSFWWQKMITENQLFLIDMHLRDILRGDASLIGWTLTVLRTQAGTVTMESVYPGCETVKLDKPMEDNNHGDR